MQTGVPQQGDSRCRLPGHEPVWLRVPRVVTDPAAAPCPQEPIWGLTASAMDPHLKHWDVMATVSAHSDAPIGYADSLRVPLTMP